TAPFYIYSNPITPAEAAAAHAAVDIVDSGEGLLLLEQMRAMGKRFEAGLNSLGFEFLSGAHPIVPLLVRDTGRTTKLVDYLFSHQILATGIKFPVVPHGDEEIRFQINAGLSESDIDEVLAMLKRFREEQGVW
ncbi:MAG: aminotransferase class I/II-fold pyridoxal phosphate-dependent enzyme, partial [Desulfobulbaceae bacterium]|nr:aminotransferase class I/II-fold pyridoxal phosphate-dependent enzyme [Desulfobulbaceae bacterium]